MKKLNFFYINYSEKFANDIQIFVSKMKTAFTEYLMFYNVSIIYLNFDYEQFIILIQF